MQEKNIIERRVERMKEENKRMVEPQRNQLTRDIAFLEGELKKKKSESDAEGAYQSHS